jgi:2-keto-4-pentenoate hydratase
MGMDEQRAADLLFACAHGRVTPPGAQRTLAAWFGDDVRTGHAVQLAVLARWEAAGERLGGWKVGMTSLASRDALGPGVRPFGYLLERRILDSGVELSLDDVRGCHLEQELGLVLGESLAGPNVTVDQARAAVRAVVPAFEVIERRFTPPLPPAMTVANGIGQWGVVLGAPRPADAVLNGRAVTLYRDGDPVASRVVGPDLIDDPFLSLARLCHELAGVGRGLAAGQVVITGALLGVFPVDQPGVWEADFGDLGRVSARFVRRPSPGGG